jgi:hypothetical protein
MADAPAPPLAALVVRAGMRRFRRHPGAWIGSVIVASLVLVAAFAPLLADRPPTRRTCARGSGPRRRSSRSAPTSSVGACTPASCTARGCRC